MEDATADYQQARQSASPLEEESEESEPAGESNQATGKQAAAQNPNQAGETLRTVWGSGRGASQSHLGVSFGTSGTDTGTSRGPQAQLWGQGQITPTLTPTPLPGPQGAVAQANLMWPHVHKVVTQKTGRET